MGEELTILKYLKKLSEDHDSQVNKELAELRAWKEKARPFLEWQYNFTNELIRNNEDDANERPYINKLKERIALLTELLGGE